MATIDPKVVEDLRAKFGADVAVLDADGESVVVKRPSRQTYGRFREYIMSDNISRKASANEVLCVDCIVYPTGLEREAIFDRKPGLVDAFAGELVKMAGGGAEAKKS